MPSKLTRLISYKLLNDIYSDRPHPNFKNYEIETLRRAVKVWYEWNDKNGWVKKEIV